jgi:preprotein translocase subunit SecD
MRAVCICIALFAGCSKKPAAPPVKLVYEIQPVFDGDSTPPISDVLPRIQHRIGSTPLKHVDLARDGESRIQVTINDGGEKSLNFVLDLLRYPQIGELRILADRRQDADVKTIELATGVNKDKEVKIRDSDGKVVARWASVIKTAPFQPREYHVVRTNNAGEHKVLILIDEFNVNSIHLISARASEQDRSVTFEFDEVGAKALSELTGTNLPKTPNGINRELAIVLDNEAFAAFDISNQISDRGQIGGLPGEKANLIADLLMAGKSGIPCRLKLIDAIR